jgi:hypothetical protein
MVCSREFYDTADAVLSRASTSPHLSVDTSAAADHLHGHGSLEWHIVHHITIHAGVLKQGVVLI